MTNPWDIKSIYDLQFYNCPSCVYKDQSKQEIIYHAYEFHPDSVDFLVKIKDDSFTDIICPWDTTIKIKNEIEANMVDSSMVEVHIKTEESHEDFPLNSEDLDKEKIKEEINSDIDEEINKVEIDNDKDIYYDDKHNFDADRIDPLVTETSIKSENIEDNIYWSR